ncbi:hypothetical protein L486_04994 [Kwoniella mangroviensis CBS 10435]|uniref:Chromatin modification-related protein n=1 Tax=Kwoniella mangroviensis CBS 10435 TaxID=1331196 RepID=A0A1B9IPP1_9TREE|nr:hypothetical protein L486_04994 [Kwoniella mangroviensis CBS 10435]
MPPRKSLSGSVSTPARKFRPSGSSSTLKKSRSKREIQHEESSPDPLAPSSPIGPTHVPVENHVQQEEENDKKDVGEVTAEEAAEVELEAWQDFAADHYEMVEQLPLELHRNFRLLRELDDGCTAQIERLHQLTRHYITERLELEKQLEQNKNGVVTTVEGAGEQEKADEEEEEEEVETIEIRDDEDPTIVNSENKEEDVEMKDALAEIGPGEHEKEAEQEKLEDKDLIDGKQVTEGIPLPDGQGGLLIPKNEDPIMEGHEQQTVPQRLQFPHAESIGVSSQPAGPAVKHSHDEQSPNETTSTDKKRKRPDGPYAHLSEIARLSREVVRTAEEKVAVAVGAYNAIDRHIRALDSALTAQEASILLGLRTSTLPSNNVDGALNLAGDTNANANVLSDPKVEDEEGMVLGLGGGSGARQNKRKKKKGKKGTVIVEEEPAIVLGEGLGQEQFNIPADPNEPRYCYCNQVSYGQMIGCENEECPLEWFHLTCLGLESPPQGKWWCNVCRPKVGLGKGGAGKVGNKNITVKSGGNASGGGASRKRK